MIHFIHSNQTRRKLEHVISEGNNNELRVLCTFLDVTGNNRYLSVV